MRKKLKCSNPFIQLTKNLSFVILLSLLMNNISAQVVNATYQPSSLIGTDAYVWKINNCDPGTVWDNRDDENFGNTKRLMTMTWTWSEHDCGSGYIRSFIRFDEMNSIPSNAIIYGATLYLYGVSQQELDGEYGNSAHSGASGTYKSNPIKIGNAQSFWNEQTITWNNQPVVDYSTHNITHPESTQQYNEDISIDVTSLVQEQISGSNNGFGIQLQTEGTYRSWHWASSDMLDSLRHPKLVVRYEVPCDANFNYSINTAEEGQVNFNANTNIAGNDYYWDFGDGTQGFGSSEQHNYTNVGSYEVCLVVREEDGDCKVCHEICVGKTQSSKKGIDEGKSNSTESSKNTTSINNLYPNPAKDQITLEFTSKTAGSAKLIIYDMTGKKVSSQSITVHEGNQNIIHNLTNLKAGIYLCAVTIDDQYIERRFVVE